MTLPKYTRVEKNQYIHNIYTTKIFLSNIDSLELHDSIQLGLSIEYILKELSILFVICVISDDKRENVL